MITVAGVVYALSMIVPKTVAKRAQLPCRLLILLGIGSLPLAIYGQANTTAEEKGMPSSGVFSAGDIDSVNLQNGNLHISIPIASVKQRGGSVLTWAFVYDTQSWQKRWIPNTCSTKICNPPGQYNVDFNENVRSGWRLSDPTSWDVEYLQTENVLCSSTNIQYTTYTGWKVIDPQGSSHLLPLRQEVGATCNGQTLKGPALDGSGIVYDSQTNTIYLKDGTQISGRIRDANGNLITALADTSGRTIVVKSDGPRVSYLTPTGKTALGPQYTTYTVKNALGSSEVYRVDYQGVDFTSDICAATNVGLYSCSDYSTPIAVPLRLTLPNDRAYTFTYANGTPGELKRIDLPTGGYITYTYSDYYQIQPFIKGAQISYSGGRAVSTRIVSSDGSDATWKYNITLAGTATVTDPIGNTQVHKFTSVNVQHGTQIATSAGKFETSVTSSDSSGTLKTVTTDYSAEYDPVNDTVANVRPIRSTTTLGNGQVSKIETDYETFQYTCVGSTYCPGTATRMNPTETREYDYGSGSAGSPLRRTDYTYLHTGNQTYTNLNIVAKPLSISVYSASGTLSSKTAYEYDVYTHSNQTMQASNAVQHDATYGTSMTQRGNLTAISHWQSTDGAMLTSTNQYDDAGNLLSTIDPLGKRTNYGYTDSWGDSSCAPNGQGKQYPTTVTNPAGGDHDQEVQLLHRADSVTYRREWTDNKLDVRSVEPHQAS